MTEKFLIDRQITIDAGHRVMTHGSKCRNIHGHTYRVHAICEGELNNGEQEGMVLDFGFLKEIMLQEIDAYCDHGFICSSKDEQVLKMFTPWSDPITTYCDYWESQPKDEYGAILTKETVDNSKLYIVPFIPTAENLAKHWYERLKKPVNERSGGLAKIAKVVVWETPNCNASYDGDYGAAVYG